MASDASQSFKIKLSNINESSTGMQHSMDKDNTWGQVGWDGNSSHDGVQYFSHSRVVVMTVVKQGGSLCTLLWEHGRASMLPKISVRRISGSAAAAGRDLLLQ